MTPSFTQQGKFMTRQGAAWVNGKKSLLKLCFTATDLDFLSKLLYELSLRPDCYFVKYSLFSRDGMHLGRGFFDDDEAALKIWAEYKAHPKLFVSIQNDESVKALRDSIKKWEG